MLQENSLTIAITFLGDLGKCELILFTALFREDWAAYACGDPSSSFSVPFSFAVVLVFFGFSCFFFQLFAAHSCSPSFCFNR